MQEEPFTKKDIKKIKRKRVYSILFSLVFSVLSFLSIYFFYDGLNFIAVIFGFLFLIGIYSIISSMILYGMSNNDLDNDIKIITIVTIMKREKKEEIGSIDTRSPIEYILHFEGDDKITSYKVRKKHFELLTVGDKINLEYSKYTNWILSIKWKNIDIENNYFIK